VTNDTKENGRKERKMGKVIIIRMREKERRINNCYFSQSFVNILFADILKASTSGRTDSSMRDSGRTTSFMAEVHELLLV